MLRPWQVRLGERIDPRRNVPIYMQIIQALIRDIERGRLTSGTYLPSSENWRHTARQPQDGGAGEDLIAQSWLASAGTRGTMVSTSLPAPASIDRSDAEMTMSNAVVDYRIAQPPERPLALPPDPASSWTRARRTGGCSRPSCRPGAYRSATNRTSRENGFQYRDPRGSPALRESIAAMLKTLRGLRVTA